MDAKALLLLVRVGCLREQALSSWTARADFGLAVAESATAAYLRLAEQQIPLSPERPAEEVYEACRAALAAAPGDKGVIGFLDSTLPLVARLAEEFGLPGCSPRTLRNLTDKTWARERFAESGVPGPRFRVLDATVAATADRQAAIDGLAFPLIIKPADSSAGRGVVRAGNAGELDAAWDAAAPFTKAGSLLAEEELIGEEISVETVTVGGRTVVVACTEKLSTRGDSFVELGQAVPARLDTGLGHEVRDIAAAALKAVGYDHGIAHTEMILTADGPRIIEVNPRPAGDCILDLIRLTSGVDVYGIAADLALGRPVDTDALERTAFTSGAAIRFLTGEPGVVRRIDGVAQAAAQLDPARERLVLLTRPGDVVEPVTTNLHRLGYVIAVGDDTATAVERAERIAATVSVVTSPAAPGEPPARRLPSSECWT
ncbi:ATP-grasp domain-containing protein [Streptomyces griseocarneus]|uniref:ATP-grasp domain-containing protein n=1 Tax=Streptomyces griseocarneus TaxID=51201 RepID=UPI00167D9923|nr:ATP-grasp domain-containing protein [Streptomyces griseocarneus]MBZ6477496.1 ATP-grasp domain-containing protein [Streptomyces griseocarneus]GHG49295.1 carboxylase [Streptomyces griseocarneus]